MRIRYIIPGISSGCDQVATYLWTQEIRPTSSAVFSSGNQASLLEFESRLRGSPSSYWSLFSPTRPRFSAVLPHALRCIGPSSIRRMQDYRCESRSRLHLLLSPQSLLLRSSRLLDLHTGSRSSVVKICSWSRCRMPRCTLQLQ